MDEQLELLHFGCRWSFGALLNFEADTISFRKALKTLTFDGTMVNEDIFSALDRDESETLLIVEPLYCTLRHFSDFLLNCVSCTFISGAKIVKQGNWRKPKEPGYFEMCKSLSLRALLFRLDE
jgi:hypothetical protein